MTVDLAAISANVRQLLDRASPAQLCAVVKSDGYGHGAVPSARAALDGGATWLAVAIPDEGAELRDAGIDTPVLLLDESDDVDAVVANDLVATVYRERTVHELAAAARRAGRRLRVHINVDTGMHRIGVRPDELLALAKTIAATPDVALDGVHTHCPVADEPANPFTAGQAARFSASIDELRAAGIDPGIVHAGNSAATMIHPELRLDLVRCGIAVYGLDPSPELAGEVALRPALSWTAPVTNVARIPAGDAVSYGLRRPLARDSVVATVPVGYADGMQRRLSDFEVVLGGKRRPIAGTITMDRFMVDCGDDEVAVGDEV
ncbi:MAG TPA: alanine racemase, partial [Mycobacteriales bacterium]|nr:alanine racemase [Mycobacteriales bacterium]